MKPVLIYSYDAYCGWCYGFSPVMKEVWDSYHHLLNIEVLSGGMILPEKPVPISVTAAYIRKAYKQVEAQTGVSFGEEYLWHINNSEESDWYPNSEKPAIALCVFKEYFPDLQVSFAAALQYALHGEGRDLGDDEAYRALLLQLNVDVNEFYDKLHLQEYKEKAYQEFSLVKQLKVTGYPSLLLQVNESKFYRVAHGYTTFLIIKNSIESIFKKIGFAE
ncbi:MAG: DsbA family protein [Segetibacter sp.]